jgi:hypothetical protein
MPSGAKLSCCAAPPHESALVTSSMLERQRDDKLASVRSRGGLAFLHAFGVWLRVRCHSGWD